eukprot:Rhum_TRINITY_DN833_c0_g1::Rhum_TRINITY_DN833_c0_g1_i1::g.2383::m.2383
MRSVTTRVATPLHVAAYHGDQETIQLLFARGHAVLCYDRGEETPLHVAALCGHREAFRLLLDLAHVQHGCTAGETPPFMAKLVQNSEVFALVSSLQDAE